VGDFAAAGPPDAPNRAPGAAAGRVRRRQRAAGSRLAALPARTALPAALARIRPPRRGETGRMPPAALPEKPCATCGRTMVWRAKWAKNWDTVRYCSAGCRRGLDATDRALEAAILALLGQRAATATICPSEAARAVAEDWEPLMERARMAARRLVAAGAVLITQRGAVVDPSTAKGPIRVRRR
jgi:hypothetical protein